MKGILHITATPIGNLGDLSDRAKEVLDDVDLIACEDTRVTRKLLSHFDIHTPTDSYHEHSSGNKQDKIIARLMDGDDVALVSDAGTPAISDPGMRLVEAAHQAGITVVSVPGPSAVIAALSIAGLRADEFSFYGFVPRKKGRESFFNTVKESPRTIVFYESPHRFEKTIHALADVLSDDRTVVVCRELTKQFESVIRGSARFVADYFIENEDKIRGEFAIVISQAS
ncbi:MAG: 16S rRNA (cytidine(1402)-2'-O)-methyltransferase [Candidatus Paceibacterota bacterium]